MMGKLYDEQTYFAKDKMNRTDDHAVRGSSILKLTRFGSDDFRVCIWHLSTPARRYLMQRERQRKLQDDATLFDSNSTTISHSMRDLSLVILWNLGSPLTPTSSPKSGGLVNKQRSSKPTHALQLIPHNLLRTDLPYLGVL
jgi:hypothetical protein